MQRPERQGSKLEISGTKHPLPILCDVGRQKVFAEKPTYLEPIRGSMQKLKRGGWVLAFFQPINMLNLSGMGYSFSWTAILTFQELGIKDEGRKPKDSLLAGQHSLP